MSATTGRVWLAGLVAAVIAAVIDVVVALLERAAFGLSDEFLALQPGPVGVAAFLGTAAGTLVFVLLRRRLRRPLRAFAVIATVAAVLSLIPITMFLVAPSGQFPGLSTEAALALIPLHLVPPVVLLLALRSAEARAASAVR